MALKQMLSGIDQLEIVADCESALEAYNLMGKEKIDLLFLDIEMPHLSGLEFAKQIMHQKALIIFTTGKVEYAIDAFELNVVDYLLKPVELSKLLIAVNKVKAIMSSREKRTDSEELDFFFVKDKSAFKKVFIEDVLFFESMGDYVKIHTKDKVYIVHNTLKNIESKIRPDQFLKVHRSYIVAIKKIDTVEDGVISILKNNIPVADAYKSTLSKKLNYL
jgi:DNA-binding LytR/AlgR family response regulator